MNIWKDIGHFFGDLFGNNGDAVKTVLHNVSSLVTEAQPIVEAVETDVKAVIAAGAADPKGILATALKFIQKYEPDLAKAQATANTLAALPLSDMFRDLASFALQTLAPSGTLASSLNLAVELAYSVFKQKQGTATSPAK
jgi:hypothetical protein